MLDEINPISFENNHRPIIKSNIPQNILLLGQQQQNQSSDLLFEFLFVFFGIVYYMERNI